MSKLKLKILLKDLQNALNLINTHFLFWSHNEFERNSDFIKSKPKTLSPISYNSPINLEIPEINKESQTTQNIENKVDNNVIPKEDSKKSSWELFPMPLGSPNISLPTNKFSSLTNKVISFPKIACAILIKINNKDEILFLERLAKIITKLLFSCQIIYLHKKEDFVIQTQRFPLTLVPMKELTINGITTKIHQQVILNNNIILPLEDINQYMSNSLLKQDLWKQLNQINLQHMQK